jgi:pimeloyl-ACP methyl ester carboxylesterase
MAAAFVRQWPARVSRLILADVAAGYGVAPTEPLPASVQNRLDDLDTLGPAGMAEKRAARLLSPSAPQDRVARVREAMAAIDPAGYRQAAAMLAQGNLGEDAAQIEVPVLVICGALDVITPPAGNRTIAENMPNAQYVEIPDAGHASYIDRPDAFNALVRNFLAAP